MSAVLCNCWQARRRVEQSALRRADGLVVADPTSDTVTVKQKLHGPVTSELQTASEVLHDVDRSERSEPGTTDVLQCQHCKRSANAATTGDMH